MEKRILCEPARSICVRKHLISQNQTFDYWHKVLCSHSWTSENKANYKGMFKLEDLLNIILFSQILANPAISSCLEVLILSTLYLVSQPWLCKWCSDKNRFESKKLHFSQPIRLVLTTDYSASVCPLCVLQYMHHMVSEWCIGSLFACHMRLILESILKFFL